MKDPHIHVENMPMPGFGHAAIRELIVTVTGLAPDLPKTVGTGCGRRRPIAMTSTVPGNVTCLSCREYASNQYGWWADTADMLLDVLAKDPGLADSAKVTPEALAGQAREYRQLAVLFAGKE